MATSDPSGMTQTVLGPVTPEALGITMTHEHLLMDGTCVFAEPQAASERALAHQPVSLRNLGWIRVNWASNLDNLILGDEREAIEEALLYKGAGGVTLVDVTTIGIARDPQGLARIARATGLNIIMGTGYYVGISHPKDMDARREEELTQEMVRDITVGVDDTGIPAGIIGELGCSWPLEANERKVLRAAARAQRQTGAPISIHPGRHEAAPLEIMEVLREAGADISRVIMGHLDRTIFQMDGLRKLAETGCYLEYDMFGQENSLYPFAAIDLPSDAQRIDWIGRLIAEGYGDRVLVAHDVCLKSRLTRYGGFGYAHILNVVRPWMRRKGIGEEELQAMLVENPRRALTFV